MASRPVGALGFVVLAACFMGPAMTATQLLSHRGLGVLLAACFSMKETFGGDPT
jgi:hypothetical protein